jgi:hypothetical protein
MVRPPVPRYKKAYSNVRFPLPQFLANSTAPNCERHLFCGRGHTELARIFHELLSRDHEDGRATWQPQGVGSEAYLNGTSQGPTPEDARKDGHILGRSK